MDWQTYISEAYENLWFLRPQWFRAFIPLGVIAMLMLFSANEKDRWKRAIPKTLQPYLIRRGSKWPFYLPRITLLLLLSLIIVALAGPTWERNEAPGSRSEAGLVILLDLSRSMLVEDIQPNRIERAKLKIKDLLQAGPGTATALVAFAGSAHYVVPFTKDYRIIDRNLDALRPDIMPMRGSNIEDAFALADSLLAPLEAPGTILLITDGFREEDVDPIVRTSQRTKLEIMAIATPNGGPIPAGGKSVLIHQGQRVLPQLDIVLLKQLGAYENIDVITVTLDNSDVQILAKRIRDNLEYVTDPEQAEEEWMDMGYWLLLPITLLALLWFRRGWMVQWVWLMTMLSFSACDRDIRFADLWLSRDQQGRRLYEKGETGEAAERFENPMWKGYAYAEAGDYEQAAGAFSQMPTAEGFYNQGVMHAQMGDYEAAAAAFQSAIALDPGLTDAGENLRLLQPQLDSLAAVAAGSEEGENRGKTNREPSKENLTEAQESKDPNERDQAQQSDQTYEGQGDITEMGTREIPEDEMDLIDPGSPLSKEEARSTLLRQATEDPAVFLRRKLLYQLRKRKTPPKASPEPW